MMHRILNIICLVLLCNVLSARDKVTFIDAVQKFSTDDILSAKADFEQLHKRDSTDDAVLYYLGLCEYSLKDFVSSEKHLKEACSIDSSNIWYLSSLASLYSSAGLPDKSAAICEKLIRMNPRSFRSAYTLTLIGDSKMAEHKDSAAISFYEQALEADPDYAPADFGKAEVYRLRNNFPAYFLSLGKIVGNQTVPAKMKSNYIQNIIKYMDSKFYWVWGEQLGKLVNSCLEQHPDDIQSRMNKIQICFIKRDTTGILEQCEAIVPLAKAAGDTTNLMAALSTIGDFSYMLGNHRKAFETFEDALRVSPDEAMILNNYAYFLSEDRIKLKKALKMSGRAIELEPDNATYLDTYGWILYLLKRYKDAKPHFKRAMIFGGKSSGVILEHYSKVLEALGEKDLSNYYRSLAENKEQ